MPASFRWPIYWEYKENFPSSVKWKNDFFNRRRKSYLILYGHNSVYLYERKVERI